MRSRQSSELTDILRGWDGRDSEAATRLVAAVYDELRGLARRHLASERTDHTLQPTALVHETYLRLIDHQRSGWKSRAQFFAVAAQSMRRILVDYARAHTAAKRGSGAEHLSLDETDIPLGERAAELVALDNALSQLAMRDERKSRVVELRFFGGLTLEETAEAMDVSVATVRRDWTFAKAWLHRAIKNGG
ncbi:MAG: sigma-70 family RNA polymerase sigma factor [Verrucomicrobia bacterium]|nr:sigma-70 family RNA polymerase sigma factor [Verrucomicrobiota bacterium]